jgi:hypothetical protein
MNATCRRVEAQHSIGLYHVLVVEAQCGIIADENTRCCRAV